MGPDRAPIWPAGLRGTITHDRDLCLAAVTDDPRITALGLDLDADAPLPPEVLAEILLPGDDRHEPRLVFSAKETVFKALYPQVRTVFGFDAVRIALSEGRFTATTHVPLGPVPPGAELSGRFWRGEGLILTALAL
jgi:4'-phosphopantetheinyl transferase EntD